MKIIITTVFVIDHHLQKKMKPNVKNRNERNQNVLVKVETICTIIIYLSYGLKYFRDSFILGLNRTFGLTELKFRNRFHLL